MKNLITGGFGLIGSALVNALGGNITVLSKKTLSKRPLNKKINLIKKDLLDINKKDWQDFDVVFHLASTVDNYNVLTNPYIDIKTNLEGTVRLLELCKTMKKKPLFVFASSFFIYGNEYDKTKKRITEESKVEPLAIYPATKFCAENIIKLYSRLYGIPYLIVRLCNVYDEYEDFNNKRKGGLNYLLHKIANNEEVGIYKGGNFRRDYIYCQDVIEAIKFLVKKRVVNDTYLIGTGKPVCFKDIIDYAIKISKSRSVIKEIEPSDFHKIVGITNFVANTSKINNLGWKARINYKEGIKRIIKRYKRLDVYVQYDWKNN